MSPANWIRQDEGEEVSWNCPWSRGREQRQLAVLGSSHPFLEQRCAVFPVDHWVPRGVAGKDGLGGSHSRELPAWILTEGGSGRPARTASGTLAAVPCRGEEPAFGCQPLDASHVLGGQMRTTNILAVDASSPLSLSLPSSPTLKQPRAAVGRGWSRSRRAPHPVLAPKPRVCPS